MSVARPEHASFHRHAQLDESGPGLLIDTYPYPVARAWALVTRASNEFERVDRLLQTH